MKMQTTLSLVFLFCYLFVGQQTWSQQKKILTKKIDSILVNTGNRQMLKAELKSIDYSKVKDCEVCQPSNFSLVIKNYQNQVLLNKIQEAADDGTTEYPFSLSLNGIGQVLAIQSSSSPHLASDQGDITLFHINRAGKLIPITNSISLSGQFDNGSFFRVKPFGSNYSPIDSLQTKQHFCLETVQFISHCGFNLIQMHKLDLDGYRSEAMITNDTIPIYISKQGTGAYLKKSENEISLVSLGAVDNEKKLQVYAAANKNASKRSIVLQKNMRIRFNYVLHQKMANKESQDFIELQINGQLVYLNGFEQLAKLGFPDCD